MAKFNGGIFSKLKGKLAGVVFQQYEGMQIGKEYQPNVKNPQTPKQVTNRAAFKLASQFVALYQYVLLVAASTFSPYTRRVRGVLVNRIKRAVDVTSPDAPKISLANAAAAVNSLNPVPSIPLPVINGSTISNGTITGEVGDIIRYSVIAYDESYNILGTAQQEFTATSNPQRILAPVTATTPTHYDILAVAMRAITGNGSAIYENLSAEYTLDVERLVAAGDVAVSNVKSAKLTQD